jgi:CRP/FNR family cyclic AMP-dependent transcriptional regulator
MLLLRNVPLFAVLPENQLSLLTSAVSRKSFPRGTTIIAAGDVTESLYVIISGRLKVMISDDEGREVILAILGPNEFFGEMGLIDDHPRSASVVALEACELLSLSKRDFKRCLSDNFEMAMTVMRGLVKRLREADAKIGSLALMDVYGRVARLLLEMSETVDEKARQAGHRQDDRRLTRDGEPGDEGPAVGRVHRGSPGFDLPARNHSDHRLRGQSGSFDTT